jgi:hypothetical protein
MARDKKRDDDVTDLSKVREDDKKLDKAGGAAGGGSQKTGDKVVDALKEWRDDIDKG